MTWQPIETAPKDGSPVVASNLNCQWEPFIVSWRDGPCPSFPKPDEAGWYGEFQDCHYEHDCGPYKPTHWVKMPEPPHAES